MISGASDEELDIAIARADVLLELQPKIDELKKENQELKLELSGYRQAILNDKEMLGLKEQNQKYKEVIDTAKEWVEKKINSCTVEANSTTTDTMCRITIVGLKYLLDILKGVK